MLFTNSNSTILIPLTTGDHYVSNFLHIIQSKDCPKAPNPSDGGIICGVGSGSSNYYAEIGEVHGIISIWDNGFYAYGFDHVKVDYVNFRFYAVWIADSV